MAIKPKLKRTVGTTLLALYGIGNIVGAGVYVLVGKIAEPAGYLSIFAFLIAALVAFCAALSYAELAARFPVSAGIAVYLHEAFKAKYVSIIMGILLVLAGTISTATLLKGFAGYFTQLVSIDTNVAMVGMIILLLAIMLRGIKESVGTAAILTIIEVGGLVFLIGAILIAQPQAIGNFTDNFLQATGNITGPAIMGIMAASFLAFYAFIGFEDMVNIAEEVKQPQKAFPKAILWAMLAVTVLYVAVSVVALGVLTPQQLGDSAAPLAAVYHATTGAPATVIIAISLIAALNGVIVNVVMGSRFLYGMAHRNWIPAWFAKLSRFQVPARGLLLVGGVALICALLLPIEQLAQFTSLLLLIVFFAVNLSLIVIRRRDPPEARSLHISPSFIPWLGVVASGALLVGQVIFFN